MVFLKARVRVGLKNYLYVLPCVFQQDIAGQSDPLLVSNSAHLKAKKGKPDFATSASCAEYAFPGDV